MNSSLCEALRGLVAAVEWARNPELACDAADEAVTSALTAAQAALRAGEPGCEVCGHVKGRQQTGPRSEWRVRYEKAAGEIADLRARLAACEGERDELKQRLGAVTEIARDHAKLAKQDREHAHKILMATQQDLSAKLDVARAAQAQAERDADKARESVYEWSRLHSEQRARADQAEARLAALAQPPSDAAVERVRNLADAIETRWFAWDDSGDSKPWGYCQFCDDNIFRTKMWETTREFVKSQLEEKGHDAQCLVTLARAALAAWRE